MKKFLENLSKTWKYEKANKKNLIHLIFLELLIIVIRIIVPLLGAKRIIYLTNSLFYKLIFIAIVLLIVEIIYNICSYLANNELQILYTESHKRMQIDLGKNILRFENDCLDKNGSGKFVQRLTNDVGKISDVFASIVEYSSEIIKEIGIFIAIFIINKEICLISMSLLLLKTYVEKARTKKLNEKEKELRKSNDKVSTFVSEMIRGARDIKMLNAEKGFINKLSDDINYINDEKYNKANLNMKYIVLRGFISDVEDLILVLAIIYFIGINRIDITLAIVIYNYFNNTGSLAFCIGSLLERIKDFNLSADRTFEIFDDNKYKKEVFGNKHLDKVKGNFEFKNVCFKYDKNEVLNNLSFNIKSNETVAFVGKSGSGKTTIFNLLCKMYNVDSGLITIDGINVNELDKDSIRGNITIISQDPYIFNMSIIDNFKLIKNNVTFKEIKEACKISCLDDYIESLPDKYETIIGEGGVNLSGGEKQRLAIARALVQNTKIILFDEATSALDNETQQKITEAINNMKKDYTILIIAHRLSTVINSDRILYLENGHIEAEGTHKELLKKCDGYKKLYEKELKK